MPGQEGRAAIGIKVDHRNWIFVAGGPTGKAFVYDARTGADLASYQLTPAGALAIREARLGADHPTTAHSLGNLAAILHTQGDLDGARRLHERALQIREACLGHGRRCS